MGDVFTAWQDLSKVDIRFAPGHFCALAERADHPAPGPSGDLIAVQAFERYLGENDVCEWRLQYADDLCSAALVGADPALVADPEFCQRPCVTRYSR